MATLTRTDIHKIVGPLDEELIIQILDTGATAEELTEAFGWFSDSFGMKNAGHHRPVGQIVRLCEILETAQLSEDLQ